MAEYDRGSAAEGVSTPDAESALREERDLYQDLVDAQPGGIYRMRVRLAERLKAEAGEPVSQTPYSVDFVSDRFAEILGITRTEFQRNPGIRCDLIIEEDRPSFTERDVLAMATRTPFRWEGRMAVRGATRWIRFESLPRLLANGDVIWTGVVEDITERKKAEEALRESEERWRTIVQNEPECVKVLDREGRLLEMNPAGLSMIQATFEQVAGRPAGELVAEKDRPAFGEMIAAVFRGERRHLVFDMIGLEGRRLTLETTSVPLWDTAGTPSVRALLGVSRDVTEQKRADLRLVESEQAYRSLADSSPDNIVRYDTDRRLVYVNRSMGLSVGFDLASYIGQTHTEDAGFPSIEAYRAKLLDVIRSGEPEELEVVVANPQGEMRTHNIRFVAERTKEGKIIGALAFGRDVTERKEAAREKQKYLNRLRQNLEDTVTVIAATVEARDRYTAGHQRRVAALAAAMAEELGLSEEAQHGIHIAGTIHDLGKIKIPAEILARPDRLDDIETRLIQRHPEAGWEILKGVEFPWPIAEMVLEHHERLDGSGYPNRLKGEQISLGARILAVADVVEAMASHRPYRPSRGLDLALSEIERDRGVLYDGTVVDACLHLFREKGYRLLD